MAYNFSLTPRVDPGHGPMILVDIDEGICNFFNIPYDKRYWHRNWYSEIGFSLAAGITWTQLEHRYLRYVTEYARRGDDYGVRYCLELLAICKWLQENYIVDCWYSVDKH